MTCLLHTPNTCNFFKWTNEDLYVASAEESNNGFDHELLIEARKKIGKLQKKHPVKRRKGLLLVSVVGVCGTQS